MEKTTIEKTLKYRLKQKFPTSQSQNLELFNKTNQSSNDPNWQH